MLHTKAKIRRILPHCFHDSTTQVCGLHRGKVSVQHSLAPLALARLKICAGAVHIGAPRILPAVGDMGVCVLCIIGKVLR